MRSTRGAGMSLLGIYLILQGLASLIGLTFRGLGLILGLLALIAGLLLLLGR
jgi:ABC-type uncharacterized transport system permease subunit